MEKRLAFGHLVQELHKAFSVELTHSPSPPAQRDHARCVLTDMIQDFALFLLGCGCAVQRGIVNAAVRNGNTSLHENMPSPMCQQLGIAAVHNRRVELHIADFLCTAKVRLADHCLQVIGGSFMLRFFSCFEQLPKHLRLLPPEHNAKGAWVFVLPNTARWVKLTVQLSKLRAKQLRHGFPHLYAHGFFSSDAVHGDDDHHITRLHFSSSSIFIR